MFERLAVGLTALSQRVDRITVQEFVDCSAVSERRMLVDLMGMGKPPDEITTDSPMFRARSWQPRVGHPSSRRARSTDRHRCANPAVTQVIRPPPPGP
jgi:hypothetical protein